MNIDPREDRVNKKIAALNKERAKNIQGNRDDRIRDESHVCTAVGVDRATGQIKVCGDIVDPDDADEIMYYCDMTPQRENLVTGEWEDDTATPDWEIDYDYFMITKEERDEIGSNWGKTEKMFDAKYLAGQRSICYKKERHNGATSKVPDVVFDEIVQEGRSRRLEIQNRLDASVSAMERAVLDYILARVILGGNNVSG